MERQNVPLRPKCGHDIPAFRVLQWNILADGLAQSGDFVKVLGKGEEYANRVLNWQPRLDLLVNELQHAKADIICLQELNHFDELLSRLQPLGYHGAFMQKPEAPELRGFPSDGSAIFFNTHRFQQVDQAQGTLYSSGDGRHHRQVCLMMRMKDLLREEQLQQQGKSGREGEQRQLAQQLGGAELLIVNTHLKAKQGAANEATRLSQVQQMLQLVAAATAAASCTTYGASDASIMQSSPGVLICGDFNASPDSSTVQEALSSPLRLKSVLQEPAGDGQPLPDEFTTWKFRSSGEKKHTIDYILFAENSVIRPTSRWRMLTEDQIGPDGLPSETYPSDHVSVCCDFEWEL